MTECLVFWGPFFLYAAELAINTAVAGSDLEKSFTHTRAQRR